VGRGNELRIDDLPPEFREPPRTAIFPISSPTAKPEKYRNKQDMIMDALKIAEGNIEMAAGILGMSRATFWRKRKKYQINN
jgi:two-component system, NtrC family, response regulator AtoC